MKSFESGRLLLRAVAAAAIGGGVIDRAYCQAPIVQSYTHTTAQIAAGSPSPASAKFLNALEAPPTGGRTLISDEPGFLSSDVLIQGTWNSTINVNDSYQARSDASVPSNWILQSVQFTYEFKIVAWLAFDNGATISQDVNYTIDTTGELRLGNVGGTLIDSVLNSQSDTVTVPGDPSSTLEPATGLNFPFEENITGADSIAFAPNGLNQAKEGAANPEITDIVGDNPTFLNGSGSVFTTFEGTGPGGGTTPLFIRAFGNSTSDADALSMLEAVRSFSIASVTVTYTFVPEPETWAAGIALGIMVAGVSFRRWRSTAHRISA